MLAFNRSVELRIQINNTTRVFKTNTSGVNLSIDFNVTQSIRGVGGTGDLRISGLPVSDIAFLSTNYEPSTGALKQSAVSLSVGYAGNNANILTGNIVQAVPDLDNAENTISLQVQQNGLINLGEPVSYSAKNVSLYDIASNIAKNNNLNLDFKLSDSTKTDYAFFGSPQQQIEQFRQSYPDIDIFINGSKLIVRKASSTGSATYNVSNSSGMIGSPKPTPLGCEVRVLLNPYMQVGQYIKLKSAKLSQMDGTYTIQSVVHTGSTRADSWESKIVCRNVK